MASMDSNINPSLLQMVRNDLIQLHCENVSWEKATDKIPAEVASYLLGDLVQYLSTVVFLRGNRCLFTLEWLQVPDASEVWNYLVEHSMCRIALNIHNEQNIYSWALINSDRLPAAGGSWNPGTNTVVQKGVVST